MTCSNPHAVRLVIRILKFPLAYLGEDGLFKFRLGVSAIVIGTNRFSTRSDFITIGDNEKKSSHSAAFFSGHRAVDTPHCCRCTPSLQVGDRRAALCHGREDVPSEGELLRTAKIRLDGSAQFLIVVHQQLSGRKIVNPVLQPLQVQSQKSKQQAQLQTICKLQLPGSLAWNEIAVIPL